MKRIARIPDFATYRRDLSGQTVGFVPTMGALHAGHAALLRQSVAENDVTVLSIYVNPTQFNNPNDLARYPDMVEDDAALAAGLGVDALFLPTYDDIYPDNFKYLVDETSFSHELCGEHRPGHFTGVLTVVMKLLNIVKPDRAYFGEKDFQQLTLIRGMVDAFFLDTEIVAGATVREADGLALSSRNLNLTECERRIAPQFNEVLREELADEAAVQALEQRGFKVDYIKTIDGRRFGAATLGAVRLIDNVAVKK